MKELARNALLVAVGVAAVVAIVGIDKTTSEQRQYCVNVQDGVWPDYQGTFKAECGGKDPPQFHEDLTQ